MPMKDPKLTLIVIFAFFCTVFTTGPEGLALAASVEETCTQGEDGTCASGLLEDSFDDEEYEEVEFDGDCEDDDESCAIYARQGACATNQGYMT